ncbi:MAG TPA: MBL fold metallo-hydrolase [Candidatus Lokiarchaeia archaeon]|nr:MBL fold metallo-hydrolase [Candidatus Lokiarchaeia archaeon]
MRDKDEIICLGFGGARFHVISQYYPTGGIVLRMNGVQAHLDPGPSAALYTQLVELDLTRTQVIFVTHRHTDHVNDVPIVIEAMHRGNLRSKEGVLLAPADYINHLDSFYKKLLAKAVPMQPGDTHVIRGSPNIHVQATQAVHDPYIPTIGFKIYAGDYCLGYTSDTEIYPEFADVYQDCDILICNLLRPDNHHCDRHMDTDELLPALEDLRTRTIHVLKAVLLYHLGASMGSDRVQPVILEQVQKIKDRIHCPVVPCQFGLRMSVASLLDGIEPKYAIFSLKEKLLGFLKQSNYFLDDA